MKTKFKGTTEDWSVRHLKQTEYISETYEINFGKDGECIAEYVHNKHDAKLIACAPKLLEALHDMLSFARFHGYTHSTEIAMAENIIKKALT